jgi:hypothetical protein
MAQNDIRKRRKPKNWKKAKEVTNDTQRSTFKFSS